jgi:urea transport system ATP-binding protein
MSAPIRAWSKSISGAERNRGMLQVDRVDLHYGAAIALRQVSIAAEPGRVTALLGRNGVGKTSLLRAIVGAHPISRGSIRWEDAEISALPIYDRARRGIAWVPQGRDIFPLLSVRENLETGFALLPRGRRRLPDEIFELFPVLRTMLRRRGGDLSGGQQQQLAIARALVTQPRLLVLDEPTEGIQPSIIKEIARVIRLLRERGGLAILLVEQYFDFARDLADRIAVMDRGAIVAEGRREELDEADVRRRLSV